MSTKDMNPLNAPGSVRAYFSHSYRAEDKERNLFFWEIFSRHGFFFTVDRKTQVKTPMTVSYLEWLMRRSDCFITVIPRRFDPESPYTCSRYQIFENGLAIRDHKPRLIFAEDGLPGYLFRGSEDEICFFHPTRYQSETHKFEEKAGRLIEKARAYKSEMAQPVKPVALLAKPDQDAYSRDVVRAIKQTVQQCGYQFGEIDPYTFISDSLFALDLEQYEAIITDVRLPYVPLDILSSVHYRCIPTIRVCHLEGGETAEQSALEMHLPYREEQWQDTNLGKWPLVLSGYRLDDGMKPVLFWRSVDELLPELASQLKKMQLRRDELVTLSQAKQYFLSIDRREDRVFISNAHAQNSLGVSLYDRLEDLGIKSFHYKAPDAIEEGAPDWLEEVYQRIDESKIFVALMTEDYMKRQWCRAEIMRAMERFNTRDMVIFPYIVESMEWPNELGRIQATDLSETVDVDPRLDKIVHDIERYLVSPIETKHEVRILYSDQTGQLGTFRSIERAILKGQSTEPKRLDVAEFDTFRQAGFGARNWQSIVTVIGRKLLHELMGDNSKIRTRYTEMLRVSGSQKRSVSICIATDRNGFNIPFEWALTHENGLPLCLEHPVRRFLTECPDSREPIAKLKPDEIRVLLVASNTNHLPQVDEEVDDLAQQLSEQWNLKAQNICKLNTLDATAERIETEIRSGKYHLFHFAGHGGYDEDHGPFIQVLNVPESDEHVLISAATLKEWIDVSELRFAYLSTCQGAEIRIIGDELSPFRPIRGLAQAVTEARVPEVVGFHWPIEDADSRKMTRAFYDHFTTDQDAAVAMYEARRVFANRSSPIWTAPILIQQF